MNKELIRTRMLKQETSFNKYASYDANAIRLNTEESDIRTQYGRDADRIIHSLAFPRYMDKTQVFSNNNNDHISKRMIHVQFVSKIARTIGRALNLNEDLIEAIALGHDIGHVPFGHDGEDILNEISLKYNQGIFTHNAQSVRTFMYLENKGKGSNLTIQVLDGILCHNGEIINNVYEPVNKNKDQFMKDYNNCFITKENNNKLKPMTLEACVVRISDIIGYIGRDIEDAITLKIIKIDNVQDIISNTLGIDNRNIINTIVLDIIENSLDQNYIKMSNKVNKAITELLDFNYKNIYYQSHTIVEIQKMKIMFNLIFEKNLEALNNNDQTKRIFDIYINSMNPSYIRSNTKERIVIDYIAGMTDDYLLKEYELLK